MKNYLKESTKHTNTVTKILILAFLILAGGYLVQKFFQYYNFQSPVTMKFRLPVKRVYLYENSRSIEPLTPTPTRKEGPKKSIILPSPTPKLRTEREIIFASKHGSVLWKIYGLESTWGKADSCRIRGNGFAGFGVMNAGQVVCYDTFQIAVDRADYWLTKNGVDKDLATALCLWNTGKPEINCMYYQNFLTL